MQEASSYKLITLSPYNLPLYLVTLKDKMNEALNSIKTYFKGVRAEWGKITWPERRQVIAETLFVVVIVFVFTVAVYFMDVIFKYVLSFIPHR